MLDELFIRFTDETGQERELAITQPKFVIGRHSSADLSVPSGKLSREHLKIERLGENFLVSDLGSSNGTSLNGQPLTSPVKITNGDRADLGGGLQVEFVIRVFNPYADDEEEELDEEEPASADLAAAGPSTEAVPTETAEAAGSGGFSWGWFIVAPVLGVFLLVFVIGILYLLIGGSTTEAADPNKGGFVYSRDPVDDPSPSKTSSTTSSSSSTTTTSGGDDNTSGNTTVQPSPANTDANAKVEQSAAAFLRRIASNDPTAFLTTDQAKKVSDKIKQMGGSSALADNINSARKNSAELKNIATQKGLPPQLLATAALTKLGTSKGDVLQTARTMSEILGKLRQPIGTELANESLLMVAIYDKGEHGDFESMPNIIQQLTTKSPESSRTIRTIWFLQKNGKISDPEFDFAIRFLAIGAITQSPKDFGVSAEPLTL